MRNAVKRNKAISSSSTKQEKSDQNEAAFNVLRCHYPNNPKKIRARLAPPKLREGDAGLVIPR